MEMTASILHHRLVQMPVHPRLLLMPVHPSLLQMPVHPRLLQMPALVPEVLECLCFSYFIILVIIFNFCLFLVGTDAGVCFTILPGPLDSVLIPDEPPRPRGSWRRASAGGTHDPPVQFEFLPPLPPRTRITLPPQAAEYERARQQIAPAALAA